MKTSEIRKRFLDFFKAKKHVIVKSDSLIPRNDPTLLFTGAGMNQFKDYFLGLRTDLKRAASIQKCLRTSDLDQVGKTPYHHSFFEMLGNFSFGDYFKEEAIKWAWEFLTAEMKLDPKRLYVSVHEQDEEAFQIWSKKIGIPKTRIARRNDHSNFWPADAPKSGPNGPCGPCSEIFFEQGGNYPQARKDFWAEDESGRYAEIWNLVFTQFERQEDENLIPLKSRSIDTGMGLERLACIMQGKRSNFEIDLFEPLLKKLREKLPKDKGPDPPSLNAIVDHLRAAVVTIGDGAHPSNEGRGYVIRKLIRRAVWQGRANGLKIPLLAPMVATVVDLLEDAYPELRQVEKSVEQTIRSEEERFQETLDAGLIVLSKFLTEASQRKKKILSGEEVFQLYDTYGFPDELTRSIARKRKVEIDEQGFQSLLEEQRKRAKASSKLADTIFQTLEINQEFLKLPKTKFLGYQTLEAEGKILWCNFTGNEGAAVLDQTPFYPEGGGQVGDAGILEGKNFRFSVSDTQKKERAILHYGRLLKGRPKVGDSCQAKVSKERREATKRNHTATHLLQAALRSVLGTHVRQVGSLVNPEKLRFDFTHGKPLADEEIRKIEEWVNQSILESAAVQQSYQSYDSAMRAGALAFFGDKYEEEVRIIDVPGRSKELCGGTHCRETGEIGAFVITSESSIGSGTRRIEAVTGMNTVTLLKNLQQTLNRISSLLKVSSDQVVGRVEKLQKRVRELEHEPTAKRTGRTIDIEEIISAAQPVGTIRLVTQTISDEDIAFLRHLADQIRSRAKQSVLALFSTKDSRVNMVIALTKDLAASPLNAKNMAQAIAHSLDGSAGGRKDLAQGGGRNMKGIKQALNSLVDLIREAVGQ